MTIHRLWMSCVLVLDIWVDGAMTWNGPPSSRSPRVDLTLSEPCFNSVTSLNINNAEGTLQYSLVSQNPDGQFTLVGHRIYCNELVIRTNGYSSYNLTVRVSDGTTTLTDTFTVTIFGLTKKAFDSACTADSECQTTDAKCLNQKCSCEATRFRDLQTDTCLPKKAFNSSCTADSECQTTDAKCLNQICTCEATRFHDSQTDTCLPILNSVIICEWQKASLSCPAGMVLNVTSGVFGRTRGNCICPSHSVENKNCKSPGSTSIVQGLCNGNNTCKLYAIIDIYGDPCPGTFKYLEVVHTCV